MRTLVVGCDASGKSTLMEGINARYGDQVGESSRRKDATAFKESNLGTVIDGDFIDKREAFYLALESRQMLGGRREDIVTSNSKLVTRFAHNVMRRCICEPYVSDNEIIERWQEDERSTGVPGPDIIVYTHAPLELIRQRIIDRQKDGHKDEAFWGFNAPFFLERYQLGYKSLIVALAHAGFKCISIDTGCQTPTNAVEQYSIARDNLSTIG